jgi:hypothetical protein
LVMEPPIYSEGWLGCQKPHEIRMMIMTRRRKMTNHTYIVVAFKIQIKYHFRFYDINPLAITISFIAHINSVKVCNDSSR